MYRFGLLLRTERRGLSVSLSQYIVSATKMAEPIDMPFGLRTSVGPRNQVLDGVQILRGNGRPTVKYGDILR